RLFGFAILLLLAAASAQTTPQTDAHKAKLDRLASLTTIPAGEWRWHDDVPHPEDPSLDDTKWDQTKLGAKWASGTRVFRRWIEIPEKIDGYAVQGSRVKLAISLDSNGPDEINVFSNGSLVFRGNEDTLVPIPLTENAQPGQKLLVAIRMECTE